MDKVLDWGVTLLSFKKVGLEITNPTLSTLESWMASCVVTLHLVTAIWDRTYLTPGTTT